MTTEAKRPEVAGPAVAGPEIDSGEVAAASVLRRIGVIAGVYGLAAGVAFGAALGWRRGLVLTASAAVSIVALRSLEGVVRRLRAAVGEAPPGLGWQYPLRLLLLVGLVLLLLLGWHDGLAVVLGLSAVPLALLVEAGLQLPSRSHSR
ncbi:MAG TPA: hypothetical protein VN811_14165 [Thermoanaerobaculia bacterium]|nr:hypothetical protein [Thermoanaerobaculia bacterium]